jgi:hypothetical protein
MHDGSTLLGIQSVEEGVDRESGHLHRVGGRTDKRGYATAAAVAIVRITRHPTSKTSEYAFLSTN